ncbi:MAG: gliding motility protein GldN [Prevotellaceae bacterium]|jgi:gliding motility associated protien GldN|nr:gliding motility protein GldN [Prevotellaceae bacterium]
MKKLLFIASAVIFSASLLAQPKQGLVPDTNVPKTIIKERKAIPYPHSREADIIWSTKLWRVVDLREKMNQPLYYPTVEMQNRQSLVQALYYAAIEGNITVYDPTDDVFTTALTLEEIKENLEIGDRVETRRKLDDSGDTTVVVPGSFNWGEVQELLVKEEWFFDKHYSRMYTRIIGICPIRVYNRELTTDDEDEIVVGDKVKKQLFWVYYPEARNVLANVACYVSENEVSQLSFDDFFQVRRFSSYIVAQSNVMNNRWLNTYTRTGLEAMLESQRIETEIFNFEHDLWEY